MAARSAPDSRAAAGAVRDDVANHST